MWPVLRRDLLINLLFIHLLVIVSLTVTEVAGDLTRDSDRHILRIVFLELQFFGTVMCDGVQRYIDVQIRSKLVNINVKLRWPFFFLLAQIFIIVGLEALWGTNITFLI